QQAQPELPPPQPQPQQPLPTTPQLEQLRRTEAATEQLLNNAAAAYAAKYPRLDLVTDPRIIGQARQDAPVLLQGKQFFDGISAQRQLAEAEAQRQQTEWFEKYAVAEDAKFAAKHPDFFDNFALQKAARDFVKENWGLTEQQVREQWATNVNLR